MTWQGTKQAEEQANNYYGMDRIRRNKQEQQPLPYSNVTAIEHLSESLGGPICSCLDCGSQNR